MSSPPNMTNKLCHPWHHDGTHVTYGTNMESMTPSWQRWHRTVLELGKDDSGVRQWHNMAQYVIYVLSTSPLCICYVTHDTTMALMLSCHLSRLALGFFFSEPFGSHPKIWMSQKKPFSFAIFIRNFHSTIIHSHNKNWERTYVPRVLCSPGPMFPGSHVPRVLCSPGPMFPGSDVWGGGLSI